MKKRWSCSGFCLMLVCCILGALLPSCTDSVGGNPEVSFVLDPSSLSGIGGTIKVELYPDKAPNTVCNIIALVYDGFYENLKATQVHKGALVQFADAWGTKRVNYAIAGEFAKNGFDQNDLKFERGVVGLSRYVDSYDSGVGDIFFVLSKAMPGYDGEYAAFGRVTEGLDILDTISALKTNAVLNYEPFYSVIIKEASVDLKGEMYRTPEKLERIYYTGLTGPKEDGTLEDPSATPSVTE